MPFDISNLIPLYLVAFLVQAFTRTNNIVNDLPTRLTDAFALIYSIILASFFSGMGTVTLWLMLLISNGPLKKLEMS